jgi:hypothetical protein
MAQGALDAVKDDRPFAGVHILAAAMLCAAGSNGDELELARRILERDPRVDDPRESESIAGTFNRQMDAAIDSVNDSVGEPTRAGRRARLAHDLDRAGLVLIDRAQVADLISVVHELRGRVAELEALEPQDLGAELLADEAPDVAREYLPAHSITAEADSLEFLEGVDRVEPDLSVND